MVALRKISSVYCLCILSDVLAASGAACADSTCDNQFVAFAATSVLLQKGVQLATTETEAVETAQAHYDHDRKPKGNGVDSKGHTKKQAGVVVVVKATTATAEFSGTETGANVSFLVKGLWTNGVELVDQIPEGSSIEQNVMVPERPTKVRIIALGEDTWGISSIDVSIGNVTSNIFTTKHADRPLWLGTHENYSKASATFDIPDLELEPEPKCITRADERATSLAHTVSLPGTACIFGVDPRDGGSHCIDDPDYGIFGWCFTSADGSSFGSCDESCPLMGQDKILARKIHRTTVAQEEMEEVIDDLVRVLQKGGNKSATKSATAI